jgi:phosphoribosylformimino-5-aminoimidazole carboxamide ribotide isomerase
MRIIIAIDVIGGKCVRLTRGDYSTEKVYNENALEVAKEIEDNGIRYLHLVDLDGAKDKKITNYKVLEQICTKTGLQVDFGGGIRSDRDLEIAFSSGAKQVTAGTVSITSPELFMSWLKKYGNDKIILGADSRNRKIATNGWLEESDEEIIRFLSWYVSRGIKYTICTDVDKDGMLEGPSADLYREIVDSIDVNLIASGGISSIKDIDEIRNIGCEGVIIGKAVYEGRIKLKELRDLC